jgi:hypothetical protein
VRPSGLIDTGVLLAAIDVDDPWHEVCADLLRHARFPIATTVAVLNETFHLLKRGSLWQPAWELLRSGGFTIAPIADADLPALEVLMARYADRSIDFADATLVHVAEREGLRTILTIDHADFETYRIGRNAKFRILPARAG